MDRRSEGRDKRDDCQCEWLSQWWVALLSPWTVPVDTSLAVD